MDPTAPKDTQLSPDPQTASSVPDSTPNPIQPGQFVVAGGDETTATNNPPPSTPKTAPTPTQPSPFTNPEEMLASVAQASPNPPPQPPQVPPSTGHTPTTTPLSSPPPPAPPTPSPPPIAQNQPDPTPFNPVLPTGPVAQEPSKMNRIKLVMAIIATIILLVLIAAVIWFFVIGGAKSKEPIRAEGSQEQIAEPSPLPKRTVSGFAQIPQATNEATASAKSPQP